MSAVSQYLYKFYQVRVKKYIPRSFFRAMNSVFGSLNWQQHKFIGARRKSIRGRYLFDLKKIENLEFSNIQEIKFEKQDAPEISIIIPAFNKWRFTYNCLSSIRKNARGAAYEIIIVDNASTDETSDLFRDKIKNVKYLRQEENLNFVGGNNEGLKQASGKYIAFLNNDTFVFPGWLENLKAVLDRDEKIGLVGSKLIYPDGALQEAGGIVWKNGNAWNYGHCEDPNDFEFNYVKDVDYCSAASIMVRAELLQQLGGFDALYQPAYFEDTDLAFRVRQSGFRTVYQPASEVIHFEGVTAGKNAKEGFKKYQEKNKHKFFGRWKEVLLGENPEEGKENAYLARDRSQLKKILLFVDNEVPSYDKDAGSYIVLEYLKIFIDLGYKIVFWPHSLSKNEPYVSNLQQMGIEVVYGGENFSSYIKRYGKHLDLAVLSRPNIAENYLNKIRKNSRAKILYLAHDLHFLREMRESQIGNKNGLQEKYSGTREREIDIMKKSDLSLVFSGEEEKIIRKDYPEIKIETIPWIEKVDERIVKKDFRERTGLLFLGGFGHPPNVDAVKWLQDEILPMLKQKIPGIFATVVGSKSPKEILALNSEDFRIAGFVEDEDLTKYFARHRVFISPLRFGAGFKGKIARSMACGLPVVTTSLGAEGMGLTDGETALIADTAEGLVEKISNLYKNEALWNAISKNSLEYIKNNCSVENAKKVMSKILAE
ncbi:MAG: glycosyltransferase [Parcubacteria group bacterium]|jgi:GT2 family glycosyltransferase